MKLRKGLWSPDEDEKLTKCISQYRNGSWSDIARKAGLERCGKSCRRRWMNHLRPDLKRGPFSPDEMKLVLELHRSLGNKWSEIAARLVGRTDNDVKNLWNTQIKRQLSRLLRNGNAPQTCPTHLGTAATGAEQVIEQHIVGDDDRDSQQNVILEAQLPAANSTCVSGGLSAPVLAPDQRLVSSRSMASFTAPCTTRADDVGPGDTPTIFGGQKSPSLDYSKAEPQLIRNTAASNMCKPNIWFSFPFDSITGACYDPALTRGLEDQLEVKPSAATTADCGSTSIKYLSNPPISMLMCATPTGPTHQLLRAGNIADCNDQHMQCSNHYAAPLSCPHEPNIAALNNVSVLPYSEPGQSYQLLLPAAISSSNLASLAADSAGRDLDDQRTKLSPATDQENSPNIFERRVISADRDYYHVFRDHAACSNSETYNPTVCCCLDSDESGASSATTYSASGYRGSFLQEFSNCPARSAGSPQPAYTEATQARVDNFPESECSDEEDWLLPILNNENKNLTLSAMMSSGDGQLADFTNRDDSYGITNWWSTLGVPDFSSHVQCEPELL